MEPHDTTRLPCDPTTGAPIPPRSQPGYYPGYSTLSQQRFWDAATRKVVLRRVYQTPPIRFFTPEEACLMEAVCARVIPQDDRDEAHHIPIVNVIDERLASGRIDGYRYEDMPPDGEAHRLGLQAIEAIARRQWNAPFIQVTPRQQEEVLQTIHDGAPPAGEGIWQRMSVQRYWMLLVQDCVSAYYAHPYAWDEIGFGGPAYPRGYLRGGQPEAWETPEQRYDWVAPPWALSWAFEPLGQGHETITPGQSGTH
ncbi:MAG TPA: gluconate 2-dehydrogenase subunit 3 family protein [Ktedonobacterales bacterium]|nr:gluconate 2-dehydrogenase subunit 3 family protein [Ktedonobacterales bacterium]